VHLKVVFNPEVHLGRAYSIASDMQTNVEHAEIIPGEQVHFHPDWTIGASLANFSSAAPDLAVVQLQRPSKYAPVKMPDTEFVVSQHPRLRTMGWAPSGSCYNPLVPHPPNSPAHASLHFPSLSAWRLFILCLLKVCLLKWDSKLKPLLPSPHVCCLILVSGRGEGEHFMDVSVADLLADRPTQLNSARDLYWASQKMPPSWCGFEAGRALVIRAAAGHPQDEDILAGIQSEETESVCWNSREASSPRPVAFTPVGSSAGNTGWVTALINAHSAGQTLTGFKQPLGASEELNCGSGEVYSTEFQSLQVCGW